MAGVAPPAVERYQAEAAQLRSEVEQLVQQARVLLHGEHRARLPPRPSNPRHAARDQELEEVLERTEWFKQENKKLRDELQGLEQRFLHRPTDPSERDPMELVNRLTERRKELQRLRQLGQGLSKVAERQKRAELAQNALTPEMQARIKRVKDEVERQKQLNVKLQSDRLKAVDERKAAENLLRQEEKEYRAKAKQHRPVHKAVPEAQVPFALRKVRQDVDILTAALRQDERRFKAEEQDEEQQIAVAKRHVEHLKANIAQRQQELGGFSARGGPDADAYARLDDELRIPPLSSARAAPSRPPAMPQGANKNGNKSQLAPPGPSPAAEPWELEDDEFTSQLEQLRQRSLAGAAPANASADVTMERGEGQAGGLPADSTPTRRAEARHASTSEDLLRMAGISQLGTPSPSGQLEPDEEHEAVAEEQSARSEALEVRESEAAEQQLEGSVPPEAKDPEASSTVDLDVAQEEAKPRGEDQEVPRSTAIDDKDGEGKLDQVGDGRPKQDAEDDASEAEQAGRTEEATTDEDEVAEEIAAHAVEDASYRGHDEEVTGAVDADVRALQQEQDVLDTPDEAEESQAVEDDGEGEGGDHPADVGSAETPMIIAGATQEQVDEQADEQADDDLSQVPDEAIEEDVAVDELGEDKMKEVADKALAQAAASDTKDEASEESGDHRVDDEEDQMQEEEEEAAAPASEGQEVEGEESEGDEEEDDEEAVENQENQEVDDDEEEEEEDDQEDGKESEQDGDSHVDDAAPSEGGSEEDGEADESEDASSAGTEEPVLEAKSVPSAGSGPQVAGAGGDVAATPASNDFALEEPEPEHEVPKALDHLVHSAEAAAGTPSAALDDPFVASKPGCFGMDDLHDKGVAMPGGSPPSEPDAAAGTGVSFRS